MKEKKVNPKLNKPIRVLHVGPSISSFGGISQVQRNLKNYFQKEKSDVQLSFLGTKTDTDLYKSIHIFIWSIIKTFILCAFCKLDIVHIHLASRGSCYRKILISYTCRITNTPYIIHLHGGGFSIFFQESHPIIKRFIRKLFEKARKILVLSKSWAVWVEDTFPKTRVEELNNGVPNLALPASPHQGTNIIFCGTTSQNKGLDTLIKAYIKTQKKVPDINLKICGGGKEKSFYQKMAQGFENIEFYGWVSPEEVRKHMSTSDILCLPSHKEGLPLCILEAMNAGLPIIASNVGSIPEAVINDKNGYLIEPGDTQALTKNLINLSQNQKLRIRMGAQSKIIYEEKFSISKMAEKLVEIYQDYTRNKE